MNSPRRALILCLTVLTAIAAFPRLAQAKPEFWDLFKEYYGLKPDWANTKATCLNCHTDPPEHTPYGKALKAAMVAGGSPKNLTVQILASVEATKIGADSWSVGQEIRAGLVPGDAKGHGSQPPPPSDPVPAKNVATPLIPTHTFHPAVVHFPIALFLFGAFLEVVGARKSNDGMRHAGYWNLVAATASLAVVVPTGLIAFLRIGFPFAGPLLTHFLFAASAAVALIGICLWRRKAPLSSAAYWVSLAVGAILISCAAFFGGALVYG